MIDNYEEIIDKMTTKELEETVSKMGMDMSDHPYLSDERRQEIMEDEKQQIEAYKKSQKEKSNWRIVAPITAQYKSWLKGFVVFWRFDEIETIPFVYSYAYGWTALNLTPTTSHTRRNTPPFGYVWTVVMEVYNIS